MLGLVIPEAMQLPDALIEELLPGRRHGGDRKANLASLPQQISLAPRPFIERFAMRRVPRSQRGSRSFGDFGRRSRCAGRRGAGLVSVDNR